MVVTQRSTALDGQPITLDEEQIQRLAATIRGQVIRPGDATYDEARRVWNGMIDKRPGIIVRCTGTADVVSAVKFAAAHRLLVAVCGGGHNVAGSAVCDGGLVIDLSPMKGIQVDPVKRIARAQPGVNWGDLDRQTQLFGLATPGGEVSTTGIAGYTLSGGMGMLHRKWGLACDNLLGVEIVTADGQVRQASLTDHPDLFWAVRGGGGNFGVVTWFEYQLYPVGPEVYSATTIYSYEDAPALLRAWRAYTERSPDEVTSQAILWNIPPIPDLPAEIQGRPSIVFLGVYAGPVDEGERALAPLRELGTPIVDLSGPVDYLQMQTAFDEFAPPGLYYYWKSLSLDALDDNLIDAIVALGTDRPSPRSIFVVRQLGGAISQVPEDATAYGNRGTKFNLSLDTNWEDSSENERMVAWTRRAWSNLRDRTGGGVYLNFAGLGEEAHVLARAGFRRIYDRLQEVKRRYDPANLFRGNVNVVP